MEEMALEAKEEFNGIIEFVIREALGWELHSAEEELFRRLLKMGRTLLMLFLGSVGTGHVGPSPATQQGSVLRYQRHHPGSTFRFSEKSRFCAPITSKTAARVFSPLKPGSIFPSGCIPISFRSG